MKDSIIQNNKSGTKKIKLQYVAMWILLWQILSMGLNEDLILVSPIKVVLKLAELVKHIDFWDSILFSSVRISLGFMAASIIGVVLACIAFKWNIVKDSLAPIMLTIKSIPVVSFIILILMLVSSRNLSVIISFLMVLPIIYINILEGIENTDKDLLEMAYIFKVSPYRKFRYIYIPQLMPFFRTACSISIGMCWKSGIAAEVIGIPEGSIGEMLYESKIYLNTDDLFAWTLVIILMSLMFEKVFMKILRFVERKLEGIQI